MIFSSSHHLSSFPVVQRNFSSQDSPVWPSAHQGPVSQTMQTTLWEESTKNENLHSSCNLDHYNNKSLSPQTRLCHFQTQSMIDRYDLGKCIQSCSEQGPSLRFWVGSVSQHLQGVISISELLFRCSSLFSEYIGNMGRSYLWRLR